MTALVFVDTNVLVYARDSMSPDKQSRAVDWLGALNYPAQIRISYQVAVEYYATVTSRLSPAMSRPDARADLARFMDLKPLSPSSTTLDRAWSIEDRFSISLWDALIVAAAQEAGCALLLSEDLHDGQEFDGVRVVNPFVHTPESVLR